MAAAGTTEPVLGPVDVPVVEGQVTIVYAVGSLSCTLPIFLAVVVSRILAVGYLFNALGM